MASRPPLPVSAALWAATVVVPLAIMVCGAALLGLTPHPGRGAARTWVMLAGLIALGWPLVSGLRLRSRHAWPDDRPSWARLGWLTVVLAGLWLVADSVAVAVEGAPLAGAGWALVGLVWVAVGGAQLRSR